MGGGLARAITIGSIVLTVVSLTFAVVFARKRSRIRFGFDLARGVVAIVAILAMAAITQVTTPGLAVVVAVGVGVGLGFAQGLSLEISTGAHGFYAKRSPLAIVLWGAGIVVMQAAGIAARTGTVRVGQTISWFSACLGIGLMVGRNGPLQKAKQALVGTGAAALVASFLVPSLLAGAVPAAAADTPQLSDDDVCALIVPETSDRLAASNTYDPLPGRDFDTWADWGEPLAPVTNSIAACRQPGYETYTGQGEIEYTIYLFATVADSRAQYDIEVAANEAWYAPQLQEAQEWFAAYDTGLYKIGTGPLDDFGVTGHYWIGGLEERVVMTTGPFLLYGVVTDNLAFDYGPIRADRTHEPDPWLIETLITPMADTLHNLEASVTTVEPSTDADEDSAPAPADTGNDADAVTPGSGGDEPDRTVAPPPPTTSDESIAPEQAAGQAVAGLIAAAAIGLITWAEAAAEIGKILSGAGSGVPATRTRTVVISGADAETVISRGRGTSVPIPQDQQWDVNVSVPGRPAITEGRVGSIGIVRSVGPIVRGPNGAVSVSVEVDAFDPTPTPPIRIDPIIDIPPEPDPVPPRPPAVDPPPLPDINETYEPSPLPEPIAARPPAIEPPPLPDINEVYEPTPLPEPVQGRPPTIEPPPEPPGVEEAPPTDDAPPPDENVAGDEDTADLPDAPAPEVALRPEEIEDFVRWGVERNRSPEDILQDLEGYNRARGGTGPIELPEPLIQVDTPAGPVTVTAAEAERFDGAVAEVERLSREREALRGEMANLDKDAAWWGGAERLAGERLIAGTSQMSSRINETAARVDRINDELARLARRPDPMLWDYKRSGMATREEALASWENRHNYGWHHDQIQGLIAERNSLQSQLDRDLSHYRTSFDDDRRLANAREQLADIENGTRQPERIDFETAPDPEEAYAAALEDWRTRDTSGRYFDQAQRLRDEIAARESLTHVSDVEPARPGDRGTAFDRPARELARIAGEQDATMDAYRELDRQIDAAQSVIDDIASRARPD